MAGGFVLSLDFELHWGVRDKHSVESYRARLLGARAVIPRLLELFERHGVAATWATVGLLFFENRDAMMAGLPDVQPRYADPRLSPYPEMGTVGADERSDPYHFAPSLIRLIAAAPRQEIGTHTFSHYYCLEPGHSAEAFRADLAAAVEAANAMGIALRSIVFPRNQVDPGCLAICREAGITAWRGTEGGRFYATEAASTESRAKRAGRLADAYLPITGANGSTPAARDGMVDVPSSRFLRPWSRRLRHLEGLRLRRILSAMDRAAARGEVFHLWFHPHNFGLDQQANLAVMKRIALNAARLRERHDWPAMTMADAAVAAGAAAGAAPESRWAS